MAPKNHTIDTLAQARAVLTGCKQIDPEHKISALNQIGLAESVARAEARQQQINAIEAQLTDLRNQREDDLTTVWDQVKRTRALVKGLYGDDSSEFELVGGTRASDRKKPTREPKA